MDLRAVRDGSLVRQVPVKEGIWSYNFHTLLSRDGSRFATWMDKMVTRYSVSGSFSEEFEMENAAKDLVLSEGPGILCHRAEVIQIRFIGTVSYAGLLTYR